MSRPGQPLMLATGGIVPPIGVSPLALWDARSGIGLTAGAVSSWTDVIRGLALADNGSTTRPAYGPDGLYFGARNVAQFDGANDTLLNAAGFSPAITAASTRPHWFCVFRYRTGTGVLFAATDIPPTTFMPELRSSPPVEAVGLGSTFGVTNTPLADVHVAEHFLSAAAGQVTLSVDGVDALGSSGITMPAAVARVTLSNYLGANFSPTSIAAIGCYAAELTAAQRTALRNYYINAFNPPTTIGSTADIVAVLGSKLILDLDPDVGITFGLGAKVAQWADQSASGNTVVQATAGSQPTRVPGVLHGHAAMRFAGTVFFERLNSFAGLTIGDKPRIYILQSVTSVASSYGSCAFELSATAATNTTTLVFQHGGTSIQWSIGRGSPGLAAYIDGITTAIRYLFTLGWSATTVTLDRNNVQVAVSPAQTLGIPETPDDLRLGKQFNAANPLSGDVYRMLIVNPAPTLAEHNAVIDLLRARYPTVGIA